VLTISPATPDDLSELVTLLEEMDAFYGDTTQGTPAERMAGVGAVLFSSTPRAYVLLARDHGNLVGLASYSFLWPAAGISTSLYLKELYVRDAARRSGAGKLLMDALTEVATQEGCSRVEWTTDHENQVAQRFYAALGHEVNEGKLFYRQQLS
jgi:ribosomal protein S18 acetylase RimI-like enzyme